MTRIKLFVIICGGFLFLAAISFAQTRNVVPYPEAYRKWVHVKSAIVGPESRFHKKYGGMHHIYANTKAMDGFRSGRFPNGSVIVFDLLATQVDAGVTTGGERKFIDVMHKDGKKFSATGGWGFEEFNGDSRTERLLTETTAAACFACHAGQKQNDSVFTRYRE
jgi:hypothetical protein